MQIIRQITSEIINKINQYNQIIIIYGPRQVGKTTLVNQITKKLNKKTLAINADESKYIDILSSRDLNQLKSLVAGYELLFIDEAQRIPEIGINLKLLVDNLPNLKIIITGSSSIDLSSQVSESLVGRAWTYNLLPIAQLELANANNNFELKENLEERLIFGSYPHIFQIKNYQDKIDYLKNISNAYLYKDILELMDIRNSLVIRDLLKLLAFQVGSQVSLSELAQNLNLAKETVGRYIDLLEKSFVIFSLSGLSRNLRKEISKMNKIYFYDLGIRNILIEDMKLLKNRNDIGQLWENFLMIERIKKNLYQKSYASYYFWRTYTGAELDLVEEQKGQLNGFEFKYQKNKVRAPATFLNTYPNSNFKLINQENYLDFIL